MQLYFYNDGIMYIKKKLCYIIFSSFVLLVVFLETFTIIFYNNNILYVQNSDIDLNKFLS